MVTSENGGYIQGFLSVCYTECDAVMGVESLPRIGGGDTLEVFEVDRES